MNFSYSKLNRLFVSVCILLFIVVLYFRLTLIASFSTDLAGIEQNVVYSIQMFLHNGNLYASPAVPPFSITQYTPLYYLLCGLVARLFNVDPATGIHQIYIIGRSLDLFFNLVTAIFVYKIARGVFKVPAQSAMLLFFISFIFSFSHNFAVRPDSLQDAMSVGAIYFFLLYLGSVKSFYDACTLLFTAILLSGLSLFAKQSGIQLIILFTGFVFLTMDWKSLGAILLFTIVVYGGFLMITMRYFPFFPENVVGGLANGLSLKNFIQYVIGKGLFIVSIFPLVVITTYLIVRKNGIFKGPLTDRFLATAVIGTFLFATVTALKMGSTVQYYVLFLNMAMLFIFKALYGQAPDQAVLSGKNPGRPAAWFSIYCFFTMLVYTAYDYRQVYIFTREPRQAHQRADAEVVAGFLRQELSATNDKYIFANLPTDYSRYSRQDINNILFTACLFPQLDILEYSAAPLKIIGYDRFEQDLRDGRIEYIIEARPEHEFNVSKNLEALKKEHYLFWKEMNGYLIYKYNQ